MNPEIENLINMALADGDVTEKERAIILRKAESLGLDKDEVELILDGKIALSKKTGNSGDTTRSPINNKEGGIIKCPSCGAQAESFRTKCTQCNFEYRSSENSLQELISQLNALPYPQKKGWIDVNYNNDLYAIGQKRAELITNFPVNNYKENILEFLGMVLQHTTSSKNDSFGFGMFGNIGGMMANFDPGKSQEIKAWKQKAQQVIMKARFSFQNDVKTLEEIENYAKQLGIN